VRLRRPRKVPPRQVANAARCPREYLTPEKAERLIATARKRVGARNPHRDATLILPAYRHGLRAREICSLRWDMLDLAQGRYHVTRRKNGRPSVHLLRGTEIRALRRLKHEQVPQGFYVFTSERLGPLTPATFRKLLSTVGREPGLSFPVHSHMRRHACGYKLPHDGHDTPLLAGVARAQRRNVSCEGMPLGRARTAPTTPAGSGHTARCPRSSPPR
jgi:type 1 fimbriae regulatory protein FimE